MDLQGLENDDDFWNINIDDINDENIPMKDLTTAKTTSTPIFQVGGLALMINRSTAKETPLPTRNTDQTLPTQVVPPASLASSRTTDQKRLPNGNYECVHNTNLTHFALMSF